MSRPAEVRPSRLSVRDLVSECVAAIVSRPGRSALTAFGVLLGVGTFVTVIGVANTASGQISNRFNALVATTVTVTDTREVPTDPFPFPENVDSQVGRVRGVTGAGVLWHLPGGVSAGSAFSGGPQTDLDEYAVSAGAWKAVGPKIASGRIYDGSAEKLKLRVAVLGESVAKRLGITTLATRPSIVLDAVPFQVIGIIDDTVRNPELLLGIAVPRSTAEQLWGSPDPKLGATVTVATRLGAATQVSHELPLAISPTGLAALTVTPPPDPHGLRNGVASDVSSLLIALALICLLVGAVGIANTTLVAVVERTSEIGLRRALGARRRHIAGHVVAESATLGGLGGLVGTSLGVVVVVGVALVRSWTAVLSPTLVVAAPLIGLGVGSIAGLYPAWRATQIEPTEALRR